MTNCKEAAEYYRQKKIAEIELKPCPFCGNVPSVIETTFDKYGSRQLKIHCCISFDIRSDELIYSKGKREYFRVGMDAVEKWNRRAEHDN